MGDFQSRKWQITINNPDNLGFTLEVIKMKLATLSLIYWALVYEQGSQLHIHIFIYSSSPIRFSTLRNKFDGAHFEACRGTCRENINYLLKTGKFEGTAKEETCLRDTFEEFGKLPEDADEKPSKENVLQMISEGKSTIEIIKKFPTEMYRTEDIDYLRMTVLAEEYKYKYRSVDVIYIYGNTGTGKSRYIFEHEDMDDMFRITNYPSTGIKFDDYKCQSVIVFEEFGSQIPIKDLLNYLDIYPLSLPARYHNKVACYTKIYITSNESLDKQYKQVQDENPETYNALLRRINRIAEMLPGGILKYEKNEEPTKVVQKEDNR